MGLSGSMEFDLHQLAFKFEWCLVIRTEVDVCLKMADYVATFTVACVFLHQNMDHNTIRPLKCQLLVNSDHPEVLDSLSGSVSSVTSFTLDDYGI